MTQPPAPRPTAPDHFLAAAEELEHYAARLRAGTPPEDIGPRIAALGRIIARKI